MDKRSKIINLGNTFGLFISSSDGKIKRVEYKDDIEDVYVSDDFTDFLLTRDDFCLLRNKNNNRCVLVDIKKGTTVYEGSIIDEEGTTLIEKNLIITPLGVCIHR